MRRKTALKATKKKDQQSDENDKLTMKATASEGSSTTYEVSGSDKLELEVKANANSWVRVRDEKGSSLKEGMMKKGETFQKNITDQSQIDLRIGYAPGVKLKSTEKFFLTSSILRL